MAYRSEEHHQRDLEQRRAAYARRRTADPEKYREKDRLKRQKALEEHGPYVPSGAVLERKRERNRQYKKEHPEKRNEYRRRKRQRMKEESPEVLAEQERLRHQQRRDAGYRQKKQAPRRRPYMDDPDYRERQRAASKRFAHGPDFETVYQEMWDAQDGCCYLCGEPLVPGQHTHIDHDHSCCRRGKTCSCCRRGLACSRCNHVLGLVADSPDLLRLIADRFEPVLAITKARIAAKPERDGFWQGRRRGEAVLCPTCQSPPGEHCASRNGRKSTTPHTARDVAAQKALGQPAGSDEQAADAA